MTNQSSLVVQETEIETRITSGAWNFTPSETDLRIIDADVDVEILAATVVFC